MSNIDDFNFYLTRTLGLLYRAHPKSVDLGVEDVIADEALTWSDTQGAAVLGTFQWLLNNGYVHGQLSNGTLLDAQVSAPCLRTLTSPEPNAQGNPLGDLAASVGSPDDGAIPRLVAARMYGR